VSIGLKDLQKQDRPRERLLRRGAEALSERELLALILGSGRRGESVLDLAARLIADFGGVRGLCTARPEELARCPGMGTAKAAAVVAALRLGQMNGTPIAVKLQSPEDVARVSSGEIATASRERVLVLVCDASNRLRHIVQVADGAIDRAPIPIREVLNAVLRHDGRAFALVHNHPSGDPTPSDADVRATIDVAAAAETVGLRFLDHVVIVVDGWSRVTGGPRTRD
jgi:DNA repair protein RadC